MWTALKDLPSFRCKGSFPKPSRWNAWLETAEAGMREWWGTRLILEYYLESLSLPSPDDATLGRFKQLRASNFSGLPLAYLSLSQQNWEHCKLLQAFGKPCWSWFTEYHKSVKSARDALGYAMAMSTEWMCADHLLELAGLCNPSGRQKLDDVMYWATDSQALASKAMDYCVELLGQRCGSLSKHGTAPHCYAHVLGTDDHAAASALRQMRQDFRLLQAMEISDAPHANSLATDLRLSVSAPVRFIMNAFEVCNFTLSPHTDGATDLLRCMLERLPDTKCIEDLHQRVRGKQNSRSNSKMTLGCLQNIVIFSNIIDQRHVLHPAAISKETFRQHYRQTKANAFKEKQMMKAKGHKLPQLFSRMLNPKVQWAAVTEASLVRSAAAWSWARTYRQQKLATLGVEIQDR